MQRRVGVKSAIKRSNSLKKEKKSNSLHVVLPVSVSINSKKRHVRSACSRISSKRIISSSKSLKKSSSETESIDQDSEKTKKTTEAAEKPAELPKDLAAHFGCFYGLEEIQPKPSKSLATGTSMQTDNVQFKTFRRAEFTRQMVHGLEKTEGTAEYARQISTLLDETVEPPDFKVDVPPAEDWLANYTENPLGYPLWYKEPYKMLNFANNDQVQDDNYQALDFTY